MCEMTPVPYKAGDVVWVKLGSCWWPGEVMDMETLPEGIIEDFKKKPLAVVKFFSEDTYEYVRNLDNIYLYNNRRKNEFIKKGMDLTRAKTKQGSNVMDKFPTDVVTAESLTNGDINILSSDVFVPEAKPQYKELFGSPSKKKSPKKNGVGRSSMSEAKQLAERKLVDRSLFGNVKPLIPLKPRITHPRFLEGSDHEVRIRQQPVVPPLQSAPITPVNPYQCQLCEFGTTRQNVFILHCKAHRENTLQPARGNNKTPGSSKSKRTPKTLKSTPAKTSLVKTPSAKSMSTPFQTSAEKKTTPKESASSARRKIFQPAKKNARKGTHLSGKDKKIPATPTKPAETKERDLEKRNSILADWDDEDEEEEQMEIKKLKMELDLKEAEAEKSAAEKQTVEKYHDKKLESLKTTTVPTDPSSIYDLIDDVDEFTPPPPRISELKKSSEPATMPMETSTDTRELDKEVANLLEETAVPELPHVPTFVQKITAESTVENNIPKKAEKPQEMMAEPVKNQLGENAYDSCIEITMGNDQCLVNPVNGNMEPAEQGIVVSLAESISPDILTVPAATLSTVCAPSATKANGTHTTSATLVTSQMAPEVAVDPSSETATYVLVTLDESGGYQQFQSLDGMGNTTLLAYDGSQGEEGTRTLYIDSSQLDGTGAGLENLILAIDASDAESAGMLQLGQQQLTLQVGSEQMADCLAKNKSMPQHDILAAALANTQVFQPSLMEAAGQDAVVKVTNTAQCPVMTPRVTESQLSPPSSSKPLSTQHRPNNDTASILSLASVQR